MSSEHPRNGDGMYLHQTDCQLNNDMTLTCDCVPEPLHTAPPTPAPAPSADLVSEGRRLVEPSCFPYLRSQLTGKPFVTEQDENDYLYFTLGDAREVLRHAQLLAQPRDVAALVAKIERLPRFGALEYHAEGIERDDEQGEYVNRESALQILNEWGT